MKKKYPNKYGFGWLKDKHDPRDYTIRQLISVARLPKKLDLRPNCSPVKDQGMAGTCVGHAASTMEDWQERVEYDQDITTSPQFIYSECKKRDGAPYEEGTYIRTAMQVVSELGVASETCCPYDMLNPNKDCPQCYTEAKRFADREYYRIESIEEMKQALNQTGVVVTGVPVYESFMNTGSDGIVPIPKPRREALLGGHALAIVGYDDNKSWLIIRNSWGRDFGDKGDLYIPYGFYDVVGFYQTDTWVSVDIRGEEPEPEPDVDADALLQIRCRKVATDDWTTVFEWP